MEFINLESKKRATDEIIDELCERLQDLKKFNYNEITNKNTAQAMVAVSNVCTEIDKIKKDMNYLRDYFETPESLEVLGYWMLNRYCIGGYVDK